MALLGEIVSSMYMCMYIISSDNKSNITMISSTS